MRDMNIEVTLKRFWRKYGELCAIQSVDLREDQTMGC